MLVSEFDYYLPERLIAQQPAGVRDSSRLLVLGRSGEGIQDAAFSQLASFLRAGDLLVLNNTRVFPARLIGRRVGTGRSAVHGARVEVFLVRELEPLVWQALGKPGRALAEGSLIQFEGGELQAEVTGILDDGSRIVRFNVVEDLASLIDRIGLTPLPPYIHRSEELRLDRERYQTVYARMRGAIAAPTAGLHFTPKLLDELRRSGVNTVEITLHVGYGTFQPVRVEQVEEHRIQPEWYSIGDDATRLINQALAEARRVIAVGTTATRALEAAALHSAARAEAEHAGQMELAGFKQPVSPGARFTDLFIHSGFKFRVISGLITNFHLPRSSLLILVAAFAGKERILSAYAHAVRSEYRFYSYGDAMLII